MTSAPNPKAAEKAIGLRHELVPGDLGEIVALHGRLYSQEYGFDHTFEAYVAGPLAECVKAGSPRDRIWLAERSADLVGCVAIVAASPRKAQLRWFLVAPSARGSGLGARLLTEALGFARAQGYWSVLLWTVSRLTAAARLYQRAGFTKDQERPGRLWGVEVVEERYTLTLRP